MASKNRSSVSVSGALYRRFAAECDAQDAPIGPNVSAIIDAALDELEGNVMATAALIDRLVKKAPPCSVIHKKQSRRFCVSPTVWYRIYRSRKSGGSRMSDVAANDALINAMLDAAGAP